MNLAAGAGSGFWLQPGFWKATAMIATIVVTSSTGEVLTAAAMKSLGDLDDIRAKSGLGGAISRSSAAGRALGAADPPRWHGLWR